MVANLSKSLETEDVNIIEIPIDKKFTLIHGSHHKQFIPADSDLLEAIEPLLENPESNIAFFKLMISEFRSNSGPNLISPHSTQFLSDILNLLKEICEFESRSSALLKTIRSKQ